MEVDKIANMVWLMRVPSCGGRQLYERFYDAFAQYGEPNIPVDKALMQSPEFFALLDRLRSYAEQHHRDHWIQCSACSKWRIISYDALAAVDLQGDWTCKLLRQAKASTTVFMFLHEGALCPDARTSAQFE